MMKLLLPLSWLYLAVVGLRNKAFDWGLLRVRRIDVPVIAVGNITVGGTGKTPLVEYIISRLMREGRKIAVVSRGYGRVSEGVVEVSNGRNIVDDFRQAGDEPLQIARKFPDVIVVVGENRVEAAQRACDLGAEVVVLDDGFQHRYLHRDLNVALIDTSSPDFPQNVLPAGMAREPWSGLGRANAVILTRLKAQGELDAWRMRISAWHTGPLFTLNLRSVDVCKVDGKTLPVNSMRNERILAFSGIGNHSSFVHSLTDMNLNVVQEIRFRDHHHYSQSDLERITRVFKESNSTVSLTTEKDVTRLHSILKSDESFVRAVNLHYMRIEASVNSQETFDGLLLNTISSVQRV